jgi:hypothetical protein
VPIEGDAARDIAAGDVVRLDDAQAQRVARAMHVDGQVVLELRPVGLEIWGPFGSVCRRTGWYVAWARQGSDRTEYCATRALNSRSSRTTVSRSTAGVCPVIKL